MVSRTGHQVRRSGLRILRHASKRAKAKAGDPARDQVLKVSPVDQVLKMSPADQMAYLAKLSEAEKRRCLLALLQQDLRVGEATRVDQAWEMPELTADGRTADAGPALSFDHRVCDVSMAGEAWSQLGKACRLVFVLDGSSWMPCGAEPRCLAEKVASAIFAHHARGADFDPSRSGAEWWAQVRQSGHAEEGIQFHWDTDENAVEQHGVNLHPHISTVTYLGSHGAPTMVVDRRNSSSVSDIDSVYGPVRSGMLSYPRAAKHVAFDGQLLHGTVPRRGLAGERITFLVNVWLNHRPSNCRRVPKKLARRLGDPSLDASLAEASHGLAEVVVEKGAGEHFESTFSRSQGLKKHRLAVPLPSRQPDMGHEPTTQLLRWPAGSKAGFWGCGAGMR